VSDFLYEKFLEDHRVYHAARAFWFKQVKNTLPNQDFLSNYLSERFENGKLFYDGNPIFNTINRKTGKAVRIVQESPDEFKKFYASFLSKSPHKVEINGEKRSVREKVIVLTLTRESLEKSKKEIREWLQG
jgi:hypothetical protein